VEAESKTLFLTNPSNEDLAAGMQGAFEEALPDAERVAILMPDNGIGKSIGPVYQEAVEAAGAEVVAFETFPAGATDVSTALTKIKGQDPDVLITGVSVPEVNAVTKQAVELDAAPALFVYNGSLNTPLADATGSPIDIPFISYGLPGTLETLKTSGEVVAVRPGIEQYASDMERVLGRKPQAYGTPGFYLYDFVHMLAEAIEQAGTVDDTAKIADALAALEHEGAVGSIAFSDTHTAKTLGDVCTVEAGAVECHVVGG
jgi:branched-chain amino acid transport system substrate-binding protein